MTTTAVSHKAWVALLAPIGEFRMCQGALRRLCNLSERYHVLKAARPLARPLTPPENNLAKILQLSDTLLPLRGVWCNCYIS
jgi:hypothetical protein